MTSALVCSAGDVAAIRLNAAKIGVCMNPVNPKIAKIDEIRNCLHTTFGLSEDCTSCVSGYVEDIASCVLRCLASGEDSRECDKCIYDFREKYHPSPEGKQLPRTLCNLPGTCVEYLLDSPTDSKPPMALPPRASPATREVVEKAGSVGYKRSVLIAAFLGATLLLN